MDLQNVQTASGVVSGEMGMDDLAGLRKALDAGYGTDVAGLTGGAALRVQSLDHTLQATLAGNSHFKLFNALAKMDAGATVDEWTEATDQGGFPGSSANGELDPISQAQGEYARRTGQVKYLMTQCQISLVLSLQNAIVEAQAAENQMGALRILRDVEHLLWYGDSSVVPTEFDGVFSQIASLGSSDHLLDAEGQSLHGTDAVNKAAATIVGIGNFGKPTDIFLSPLAQADFDTSLQTAYRVPLPGVGNGGLELGAPVNGIRTSWGDIKNQPNVFLQDEGQQKPFEVLYPAVAAQNAFAPAAVTAGAPASAVDSKFGATHAGNYYYAVAGVSKAGQSMLTKSAQVAVAAGEAVTLTIDKSAGGAETGYAIYRGRKNGTNSSDDLRLVCRIPRAGNQTVWTDKNRKIPGTSKAAILNLANGYSAITWRKLLPLTKFALYPTNAAILPWALLLFGYLRISKRNQHVVIENVLPNGASWRPFG